MKYTWWKHGVIYHVYIRSFYDSNNDGIGDLEGLRQKLQYIKELGVDAVWLSPFYKSPNVDFGYDVADYMSVDGAYGCMADFDRLLSEAHQLGLKIIIDMILNHTSDHHPWFVESRSSVDNPKRDWYLWEKPVGGKRPTNWKSSFGNSAWELDEQTNEYYYHSFMKSQPDLNWRNSAVKEAMFSQVRFWLEKGVDGIRLDVINYIVKDKKMRNNPGIIDRVLFSKKVFTRNRNKSIKIIKELRALLDEYPGRMSVGEIYTLPPGNPALVAKYIDDGKHALHLAFDFSLIFTRWNARKVGQSIQRSYKKLPKKGWPTIVLSNHDLNRSFSRPFCQKTRSAKARLKALLMLSLKGTPFVYYGEEIGMSDNNISRNKMLDPLGRRYWPFYCGRDRGRTPMQWNTSVNSGFSEAEPWLPVHANYSAVNVETELNDRGSILHLYKEIIALRKKHPALLKGKWELFDSGNSKILAYKRKWKKTHVLVLLNFSRKKQSYKGTESYSEIFSTETLYNTSGKKHCLKSYEGKVMLYEEIIESQK